jgi:hypothetical protein
MKAIPRAFFLAVLVTAKACPAEFPQIPFDHHDWEIACDNTRTCRAAGYQADDAERNASILLTRRAGPAAPVQIEFQLEATDDSFPKRLRMRIDGKDDGETTIERGTTAVLPLAQTAGLLAALPKATRLAWTANGKSWTISLKGANAVLLKMDEFQGRVGTTGALIRKGQKPESSVLPFLPVPETTAAHIVSDKDEANLIPAQQRAALFAEIGKTISKDAMAANSCEMLNESTRDPNELRAYRLSDQHLLVSTACWQANYNHGDGYWVVNAAAPYLPVFVTNMGTAYAAGTISSTQLGRGLADCTGSDQWTWDGRAFVHTESSTTGKCKHVAPGGAWELPTLVVKVNELG